jgi:PHP family Zn ribbon phosphoesterase
LNLWVIVKCVGCNQNEIKPQELAANPSKRHAIGLMMLQQDLHIHTTYSTSNNSVVPEQTVALVAAVKHAIIVGISDHFECLVNGDFEGYEKEIRQAGLKVGVEVDGQSVAHYAATQIAIEEHLVF